MQPMKTLVQEPTKVESTPPLDVRVNLTSPYGIVPTYGTDGAAAFDFYYAAHEEDYVSLYPGERTTLSLGICMEVPEKHVLLMFSRSGHGFKNGIRLSNCVGVIDSDYRGEIAVAIHNDGETRVRFYGTERIAQGIIMPIPTVNFVLTEELSNTERGSAGFGSTGK